MNDRLTLKPTEDDITWWMTYFVPNLMLWWWDGATIPNASHAGRVLDRVGARKDPLIGDIATVNTFHMWAMHENVENIIVDDGSWIGSLTEEERQHASELQVRFRRGLCIPLERFGTDVPIPQSALYDGRVVLDQSLWASLPESARRSVTESELADWDPDTTFRIPENTPQHVTAIANTFVLQEGVNCLSVTAFALTANREDLFQWMLPDDFSAILDESGYQRIDATVPTARDVLVFRDEEGTIVHAAYALQPDRILNKSGQTSFNPIAIVDLSELLGDWSPFEFEIYRR